MDVENSLSRKLGERKVKGNYRALTPPAGLIDFLSNDYLGLAHSRELAQKIKSSYEKETAALNGSTGSRLLSGNAAYAIALEMWLARLFKGERALFFNSGYIANLSVLSCIPQKGDTIIYDERAHASMREGIRLSFAESYAFKHNDLTHLQGKLRKAGGNKFVVVESVYSMDGDECPLNELITLCQKHNAYLIVDEAHSTGIYGEDGRGLACSLNLHADIFARIYTFGKGMGCHGAVVVGSSLLIDYLVNFARPFIYTTASPLHNLISVRCAFDYLRENNGLQNILRHKITLFKTLFKEHCGSKDASIQLSDSTSPIQALIIPGNERVKDTAQQINRKGFEVSPIMSPTVKQGEERLRICLHTYNSDEQIQALVSIIGQQITGPKKQLQ